MVEYIKTNINYLKEQHFSMIFQIDFNLLFTYTFSLTLYHLIYMAAGFWDTQNIGILKNILIVGLF